MNKTADLILENGKIWTVDPQKPWAEAVAIRSEHILLVGSNSEVAACKGPGTEIVDLAGRLVLPGFIDSHTHFLDGGFSLTGIQFRDVSGKHEFIERIGKHVGKLAPGSWIRDGNWDHQGFSPPVLPAKEWIDGCTPDNPVYVSCIDMHTALVNSRALKLAGISRETPSPPGGKIVKDRITGEPTGILKDSAMTLVKKCIPDYSMDEKIHALQAAMQHAIRYGVTSVHDMMFLPDLAAYQALERDEKLSVRVHIYIPISEYDVFTRVNMTTPFGSRRLKLGGLKAFVDGSLGSLTALFFKPYIGHPDTFGIKAGDMFPEGRLEQQLEAVDKAGLQVAVHAIGDKANSMILDIFSDVVKRNQSRDRRWRIEHVQHLHIKDLKRFSELGVIASVQPYHLWGDGCWAGKILGPERMRTTFALKSLLDNQTNLTMGSDWTVASLNPLSGIYAAVTRHTRDGKNPGGWIPEQRIALEDAIRGYTINGAFAEFSEGIKGSISAGKLADIVVLDQDLFTLPPEEINKTRVDLTIFDGKVIFSR